MIASKRCNRLRFLPLVAAIGASLFAAGEVATADEVVLRPDATFKVAGGRVRGQITSESPTEIKIRPAVGADQTIPVDQVESVSYDGATPSFALAQSRVTGGNLAEAVDLFQKAATEAAGNALLVREALFQKAALQAELAQVDPGKAEAAATELTAFVAQNGTARQLGPALLALVRLQLARSRPDEAEAALRDLSAKVPWAADRAAVLQGRVLVARGENEQAVAAFDRLIADAPKGSARARQASLARAEALAALRRFDEASTAVQEVIAEAPPEDAEVQAEAHNTLGDCHRAAGRPKDALYAYLKTDLLYDRAKDQHPRALAQIEQLFRQLKRDDRADAVRERHKQLYPQSPWLAANRATAPGS